MRLKLLQTNNATAPPSETLIDADTTRLKGALQAQLATNQEPDSLGH